MYRTCRSSIAASHTAGLHLARPLLFLLGVTLVLTLTLVSSLHLRAADDQPNLAVSGVSLPGQLSSGQSVLVDVTIWNGGPVSATDVPVALFDASNTILASAVISLVSAYEYAAVSIDWTPSVTGVYTVAVVVDPDNFIAESDETDNREEVTVRVRGPNMTWYVNGQRPTAGDGFSLGTAFRTIEDGLDAAVSGDTVQVAPGVYRESLWVPTGVALIGAGFASTTLEGDGGDTIRLWERSVISGFTVVNTEPSDGTGIFVHGSGAVISGNRIKNYGTGLFIYHSGADDPYSAPVTITHNVVDHNDVGIRVDTFSGGRAVTATLSHNTVVDNDHDGVLLGSATSFLSNNIVTHNGRWGVTQFPGGVAWLARNNIWGNEVDTYGVDQEAGAPTLDPLFQDQATGDYRLSAGSPLRARVQGTGQDLGALPFLPAGARPRGVAITAPDEFRRGLTWQPVTGATGYWVYLGTAPHVYTERFAIVNATDFIFPFLFAGLPYYAAVSSRNAAGHESELSIPATFSLPGVAAGVFEESSPLFRFGGDDWQQVTDNRAAGGAYRVSRESGSSLSFAVVGDAFTLLRRVGPDGGWARLEVDGSEVGLLEFSSPLERWQVPATVSGLGTGVHHVSLYTMRASLSEAQGTTVVIDQLILPAVHISSDVQRQAIARVNEFRLRAGLTPVREILAIDAGAQAHAEFLSINRGHPSMAGLGGHTESPDLPGFTGVAPWDRARYFGYTGFPGEDVHGLGDPIKSVDGWMATVYHRNLILCYDCVDGGYGMVRDGDRRYDVLDMGGYLGPYPPTRLLYTYPANRQSGVPRDWSGGESPDPLPGKPRPVGYPISLYIAQPLDAVTAETALTTPFHYRSFDEPAVRSPNWQLTTAALTDADGHLLDAYVLDQNNDPPQYLGPDNVFLIAKRPLAENTTYYVHMAGVDSRSVPFDYRWSFATGASVQAPSLALSTAAIDPVRPAPGDKVTVRIVVRQSGPSARWAQVAATLPPDLTYLPGTAHSSQGTIQEGTQLLFDLGVLSGEASISFDARVANNITDPTALIVPVHITWDAGQLDLTAITVVNGLQICLPSVSR